MRVNAGDETLVILESDRARDAPQIWQKALNACARAVSRTERKSDGGGSALPTPMASRASASSFQSPLSATRSAGEPTLQKVPVTMAATRSALQ